MAGIPLRMSSLREAAVTLFQTLDQLGITYAVGGSFASSFHGVALATQDIDVVIDLHAHQIRDLYNALIPWFYIDEDAIVGAVGRGFSFNVIHFESGLKFDLFVASRHPLGSDQLAHRRLEATELLGGEPMAVSVISAEDILLAKLLWYQEGGNVSERQWNDLLNLVRVQGDRLDRPYLDVQGRRLGVSDLLVRLLS
jgi:hypothetical protein